MWIPISGTQNSIESHTQNKTNSWAFEINFGFGVVNSNTDRDPFLDYLQISDTRLPLLVPTRCHGEETLNQHHLYEYLYMNPRRH